MKYEKTLKKISKLPKVTEELIVSIFEKDEDISVEVTSKDIGKPGFEIATDEGVCFVTERSIDYYNKKCGRVTSTQKRMLDLAIPVPLYIGEGQFTNDIFEINKKEKPKAASDEWLHSIFSIEVALTYFNRYFSVSESFKEYKTIIFEAIEAYYIGMDHIAILSLMPIFEAGLRNIQTSVLGTSPNNVSSKEFENGLRDLTLNWGRRRVDSYAWYPGKSYNTDVEIDFFTHICPQSDVINSFKLFFSEVLYKPSSDNTDGFNRHIIVHMLKNDFNNPANFVRIFLALTHIMFIESLNNKSVPFFWPGYNDNEEVKGMSAYIRLMSERFGYPRRKLLNQLEITQYSGSV
ncbi:hypothetical protein CAG70_05365 [Photobacterium halotolerans]|uniref:hypothetical protein n=1 Tax=Photobacterium halotolerans TaxID=265726 RepID=UPI0013735128|nr:hypothetical protein [Photobacterium halotolerans]NAX46426.1 hypothetical protein [Photobacterium halotolerans]